MFIEIDGISIELVRKSIKNLNLRIYPPDGQVKVSAPMRYSEQLIREQLIEKSEWIRTQRDRIRKRSSYKDEILQTGATIQFKGKSYLLIIEEHHGPSQIKLKDELICCYIQHNATHAQIQTLLDRWFKKEMASVIPSLMIHWEAIINVKVAEWGIKKMKTRWGSCNTQARRVWLNLNLIKKPLVCLEYVLVHELVHLHEASHNQRFYTLMSQYMPKWQEYKQILEGGL